MDREDSQVNRVNVESKDYLVQMVKLVLLDQEVLEERQGDRVKLDSGENLETEVGL
jgi:hypothetical protein